MTERHAPKR